MEMEIIVVIVGLSIIGIMVSRSTIKKWVDDRNDTTDKFKRAFAHRQLVAVHAPDGKVTFQTQDHAEAENHISEKEHYRNLLTHHTQTIGNVGITHVYGEGGVGGNGSGGYVWSSGRGTHNIPSDVLHQNTEAPVKVETPKPVEKEQVIVQHRPGERFMDIVGE
jgi:hypothetical protein